jgi:dienelactone hydrolase
VLCQPLGYEHVCAHRTFRTLAEDLAAIGVAALRFDYDGTGDSAGDHTDPGRVAAWIASIGDAAELLRVAGVPSVGVVGMRLGALLVAQLRGQPFDAAVLWDPVRTGRALVRRLRALQLVTAGPGDASDDGSLEVMGSVHTAETLTDLRQLEIAGPGALAARVLVLERPDEPNPLSPGANVETGVATGQDLLLERSAREARRPAVTADAVVRWLDGQLPRASVPVRAPASTKAQVRPGLEEELLRFGPAGIFGVSTTPLTGADTTRPTLLLLNTALQPHIGTNRIWVDWGRDAAATGFRVVRVDLSGIGESDLRADQPPDRPYAPEAQDDLVELVRAVDLGGGVVVAGHCSGGWHALRAARIPGVRAVWSLNPPLHLSGRAMRKMTRDLPRPMAVRWADLFHRARSRSPVKVPGIAWRLFDRIPGTPAPTRIVEHALDACPVLLVLGAADEHHDRALERAGGHLRRLAPHPALRLEVVPGADHSLDRRSAREAVLALLSEEAGRYTGTVTTSAGSASAAARARVTG